MARFIANKMPYSLIFRGDQTPLFSFPEMGFIYAALTPNRLANYNVWQSGSEQNGTRNPIRSFRSASTTKIVLNTARKLDINGSGFLQLIQETWTLN